MKYSGQAWSSAANGRERLNEAKISFQHELERVLSLVPSSSALGAGVYELDLPEVVSQ